MDWLTVKTFAYEYRSIVLMPKFQSTYMVIRSRQY